MSPKPDTDSFSFTLHSNASASDGSAPAEQSLFDAQTLADSPLPGFLHEQHFYVRGIKYVAGVDEAGRGPLAGPVVAAAVVLDKNFIPAGLNDSKKLSGKNRENLFTAIIATANVAWSAAPPQEIDRVNIRQATLNAMTRAVLALPVRAGRLLIDGRDVPIGLNEIGTALVKGDSLSQSIAAASIVAKVIRDRLMLRSDLSFPEYGFCGHKGYGAASHMEAIEKHGPCPLHRMSFSPMKERRCVSNKKAPL